MHRGHCTTHLTMERYGKATGRLRNMQRASMQNATRTDTTCNAHRRERATRSDATYDTSHEHTVGFDAKSQNTTRTDATYNTSQEGL